jgi:hypothetical protein
MVGTRILGVLFQACSSPLNRSREGVDAINLGVKAVLAQFIADPQQDEDGAGHADGQAQDVDE